MIDNSKFFFNKSAHTEMGEELNTLATTKNVQVSRWVNNSKGRQIVTYIVHEGERNDFASKQENILFKTSYDAGRGNKVQDEIAMMIEVRQFLNSIVIEDNDTTATETTYINTSDRYGDAVAVTIEDYRELNPDGEFTQDADGIYEGGYGQIAEAQS